jgi:hypothetical protein
MNVRRHASAADYLDAVGPALLRKPVINQLAIGIAQAFVREPDRYGPGAVFFSVELGDVVHGAALQTPPWPVQVSDASPDAARALARAFAALPGLVTAVSGPDDAPATFAAEYATQRGCTYALEQALGTFELTAVNELPIVAGHRVIAGPEHAAIVQRWLEAFHAEAVPHDPPIRADAGERAIATGRTHLWLGEDGTPVSYAFNNRDIEGWASIGPVYTPSEARSRGFATALVASVSQFLLDQGRPGCTLFTNLANPTSNAIYERIGYRRIGSAYRYALR